MVWIENHTAKHNPLLHIGFWATWVIFFTLLQSLGQESTALTGWLLYYLFTLPVFVTHTYLIAYWLIPDTFLKKRYGLFAAWVFLLWVVFSLGELVFSNEFVVKFMNSPATTSTGYLTIKNVILNGIGNHYIILVFLAIKVGKAWYRAQTIEEEEKQRKLETSIEIYNYQFQPRVMRRLMVLLEYAIQKDKKRSPDFIILISDFLSTFLKENSKREVYFSEEARQIEMYLELFAAASPEQVTTNFSAEGDLSSIAVPYCLFLPVVDYAVSLGKWCNSSCICSVLIREENRRLLFSLNFSSEKRIDAKENIDTEMLQKRLLKNFPNRAGLKEEKGATWWKLESYVFFQ